MTWSPPDVPLDTLPFFKSAYYKRFITFELSEEETDHIRWEALLLPQIEIGELNLDDVALGEYVLSLVGRDLPLAKEAAALIEDSESREDAQGIIYLWEHSDVVF